MWFPIIVFLSIVCILLCRLITDTRKAFAVILFCINLAIHVMMQLRWEVYEHSPFYQKLLLSLLFIAFLIHFTIRSCQTTALIKFNLAFAILTLFSCILVVCIWEHILDIPSELFGIGIFVLMAPLYSFRHIGTLEVFSIELPVLIIVIPLVWALSTGVIFRKSLDKNRSKIN